MLETFIYARTHRTTGPSRDAGEGRAWSSLFTGILWAEQPEEDGLHRGRGGYGAGHWGLEEARLAQWPLPLPQPISTQYGAPINGR